MTMHILMPAMSPTMESGTLAKWLVSVGDLVRPGDVVAEIETDKATLEVEADQEGVIAEILVSAGTEAVPVQTPIARLAAEGAQACGAAETLGVEELSAALACEAAPRPPERILSPAARRLVEENGLIVETLEASGRNGRITKGDALAALSQAPSGSIDATPLARKIAQQAGIDLARIQRGGRGGRIGKADVVGPRQLPPVSTAGAPTISCVEPAAAAGAGLSDLVALDGMRRTIARRMSDSFREVPHFPLTIDVELDELLAARATVNAMLEARGIKVSVNDMLMKAAAVALKRVPEVNASYTPQGILLHADADIAMAVAVPGGLITPIIRACNEKGLAQIATEARDLAERARHRKLKPEEFQGGTFSVSNLGMFGVRTFSSIINEPQGAILSIGAAAAQPVVRDGNIEVATVMSVTLTCDHRAMDGAVGARWLQEFKALLESPIGLAV